MSGEIGTNGQNVLVLVEEVQRSEIDDVTILLLSMVEKIALDLHQNYPSAIRNDALVM